MTQFQSFEKNVEVNGQTILAFVEGMESSQKKALEILKENGLINIKPEGWYAQQDWLNAFKTIAEIVGP